MSTLPFKEGVFTPVQWVVYLIILYVHRLTFTNTINVLLLFHADYNKFSMNPFIKN